MGLFGNEVRREFIARPDTAKGQILYKWRDTNIRKLSQLTVEQDEQAVFFRDGQGEGTGRAGRSTLDSCEIPFLGKLVDAASGGNLFKTELYFVSTREFPDLPFGGSIDNVVDPDTGLAVGLRVFGEYSMKIVEPQSLILNLVGTQNLQTNDEITNWMREQLLKTLRTDVVSNVVQSGWAILGIASHTEEIEATTIDKVQANVNTYGCQIVLLFDRDREVTEADDLADVGVDVGLHLVDRGRLDLLGVGCDPQDRPAALNDVADDIGSQRLEQLFAHPVGDLVVGLQVLTADQIEDQRLGLDDLHRVLAED